MPISRATPVVLIAEDDEDLRLLVSTALRREGYEVVEAANGVQAIELADQHEPALAVLDINMPHVDGVQVAEHLHLACGDTAVIFLTAQTRRAELDRMFGTGPAGYIAKPFPLEKLREQVRAALAA